MKKAWFGYALLGIVCFSLFLVIFAPAEWLAWGLLRATRGVVTLNTPTGSLWSGEGSLVVHRAPVPPQHVGQVRWRIHPFSLFTGKLALNAELTRPDARANALTKLGFGGLELRDVNAELPAALVGEFYAPASLIEPAGKISLTAQSIDLRRDGSVHGNAEMTWQDAASSWSTVRPLGTYRLTLVGEGQTVQIKLDTTTGTLNMTGNGNLQLAGRFMTFNGAAVPQSRPDELEPLLRIFGPDQGGGRRVLSYNGPMM